MITATSILAKEPTYKTASEAVWKVGHYLVKQKINKFGGRSAKYFLYDTESQYYDVVAYAVFNTSFYLEKYLELLALRESLT